MFSFSSIFRRKMQVALIRINKRWESEYVKLVMKWTGLLTRMNYVLTEVDNIVDIDIKFSAYDFMFRYLMRLRIRLRINGQNSI
jgi:hypothetical protein